MSGTGDGATAEVPWRSPTLYVLLGSAALAPMDVPLISPVLPAVREALAVSDAQAGLLVAVYAVPGIVLAPVYGMLADRLGRRRVLLFCLVGYGTFGSLIATTTDFGLVLALRFLQGCTAGSVLATLAMTLVGDYFEGARRNAVMGLTTAALSVGVAVYPALGGYLASVSWNAPFLVYGLSFVVAALAFVTVEEPDLSRGSMSLSYVRDALAALPARRAVAVYGGLFAAMTLLFGAVLTALPFLLADAYRLGPARIGLFTSAALVITAVVSTQNGRLARRFSDRTLIATGFVGYGVGLVGTGLGLPAGVVLAGLAAFSAGHGLVLPSLFTVLSGLVSADYRGGVMSLRTSMIGLSQAVGPAAFTVAGGVLPYATLLLATGVAAGLGGAAALATRPSTR